MCCNHCNLMSEYYSAREAQEGRAEEYSKGYDTELEDFYDNVESRITFKDFLVERKAIKNYLLERKANQYV